MVTVIISKVLKCYLFVTQLFTCWPTSAACRPHPLTLQSNTIIRSMSSWWVCNRPAEASH